MKDFIQISFFLNKFSLELAFDRSIMAIRNDIIGKSGSVGNIIDTTTDERRVSVLIVDDDPLIQKIHRIMLKQFKLDVDVVENGKHAVDLHRSGASFNLILMDMEMPIMNGIEVCHVYLYTSSFFFNFLQDI